MESKWQRKPRVLVMSDSSTLHTGFALVARQVAGHLQATGKYDLRTIGWFHRQSDMVVPYDIIGTRRGSQADMEEDKYAKLTFPEVVATWKPDLVIAIGDPWMVDHTVACPLRQTYKLVLYIPVDGMPLCAKWVPVLEKADKVVLYGNFGYGVVKAKAPHLSNLHVINHGVDIEMFRPLSRQERDKMRKQMGADGLFVIGTVSRNQPRKQLPRMFKAMRLFLNPYSVCQDCKELFFAAIDACQLCGSKNMTHGEAKSNVRMYLHMALNDFGWDIHELTGRFGMTGLVAYPRGLGIGRGVDEQTLVRIVNAMDVFTLPTGGEGWGLPILEAMACGVPTVVTDYSGHVDFCQGASELIRVTDFDTEEMTNVERAMVDVYDYAMRLDKLYMDDREAFFTKWGKYLDATYPGQNKDLVLTGQAARAKLGTLGRQRALAYTWKRVVGEWEQLVDSMLDYVLTAEAAHTQQVSVKCETV